MVSLSLLIYMFYFYWTLIDNSEICLFKILDLYPGYFHAFLEIKNLEKLPCLRDHLNNVFESFNAKIKTKKSKKGNHMIPKTSISKENPGTKLIISQPKSFKVSDPDLIHKLIKKSTPLEFKSQNRIVFFWETKLDSRDFLCFGSKPNSLPEAIPIMKYYEWKGLFLIPEFLSKSEEEQIVAKSSEFGFEKLSNRRVQHFGHRFIYGANSVNANEQTEPIPILFFNVLQKIRKDYPKLSKFIYGKDLNFENKSNNICQDDSTNEESLSNTCTNKEPKPELKSSNPQSKKASIWFDQVTINEYRPGSGIPAHVDSHSPFEEPILSISLLSGTVMTFKNLRSGMKQHFCLPRRGLLIMTGEGRYLWTHCIQGRKIDRIQGRGVSFRLKRLSLTYRAVKQKFGCECEFPEGCDDVQNQEKVGKV